MLHRRPLVKTVLHERPTDLLAVSGLGSSTWDLCDVGDNPLNFCFIGAMGQASPFALGLAIAQPNRRVILISGDGEILMGMGALATIANQAPPNLSILVLDNESYVETGNQPTATAGRTDLEAVAKGCGFVTTTTVSKESEVDGLRDLLRNGTGPVFAVAKIAAESLPLVFPHSFDGVTATNRFRDAVLAGN